MSEVRLSWQFAQPVSAGYANVRLTVTFAEAAIDGYPNVRLSSTYVEAAHDGYPNIRASLIWVEALFPVTEEPAMPTTPFPGFGNSVADPAVPAGADPASTPLPGLTFSVHKKPIFNTKIDEAANGREFRTSYTEYPRWEFELEYEFLKDPKEGESSLKTIMGFYTDMQGPFTSWLFKDPDDYLCEGVVLGEGDDVTTEFYFRRYIGSRGEPVGQIDTANDINIYADGVLVPPADYTLYQNRVVFDSAPLDGVALTADFQFFFVCRFLDDDMDFEKFMDQLWNLRSCSFKSILT